MNSFENFLTKAFQCASDAICLLVANGAVVHANKAFTDLFGDPGDYHADRGESMRFEEILANREAWPAIAAACRDQGGWRGELELNGQGRIVSSLCRADRVDDDVGRPRGLAVSMTDISQRKRVEQDLLYLANHDPLTGLYNRRYFGELLDDAVKAAKTGVVSHLLYLDLDNFKVVNDSAGHAAGDLLLRDIAQLLKKCVRAQDCLARFGGDEFTVLLRDMDHAGAMEATKKIVRLLDDYRFMADGKSFAASGSVGVAIIDGSTTGEDVLAQVDSACYMVKAKGRNGYAFFRQNTAELQQLSSEANWSILIKDALREGRFEVWLQPIRNVRNNVNAYFEVLLRMRDRKGNLVLPGAFLPAAERFGNMHQLDHFVIKSSMELLKSYSQLKLSINLSAKSLNDPNLPGILERYLREASIDPARASFEITETAMIQNLAHARQLIVRIKNLGCKFALDDFGAGASSMIYLRDLPVDFLKIDGSFVKGLEDDHVNRAIVKSINDIAHILGKQTVAEYVSTAGVLRVIQELGIDYAQGFHVCVPAPPSAFFSRQRGIVDNRR